jgi:hypothetical protein
MVKKYQVTYFPNDWSCTIELDEQHPIVHLSQPGQMKTCLDAMRVMVEFWTDWEYRLDMNDGDLTKTFLQQLAREIVYIVTEDSMAGVETIIREFNNREGWCPMDGSFGIKITSADNFDIPHDQFEIEEVKS